MRNAPIFQFAQAREGIVEEVIRRIAPRDGEGQERAREYATDICGNFAGWVHRLSVALTPRYLEAVCREALEGDRLDDRFEIQGDLARIRQLAQTGTVVLVPTHLSNLDSPIVLYAAERIGLPPLVYGAGKNLFSQPLIGRWISLLGAYRIDRQNLRPLYIKAVNAMSSVLLEHGLHSCFFPGGGRTRSGALEQELKRGLLGTCLTAYANNLKAGKPHPDVFLVPCTLNAPLVLEAPELSAEWLGKKKPPSHPNRWAKHQRLIHFIRASLGGGARMIVRLGDPLDPFGNPVTSEGRVRPPAGWDPSAASSQLAPAVTVRALAAAIVESYRENNVAFATHAVAFALTDCLRRAYPQADEHKLGLVSHPFMLDRQEVIRTLELVLDRLQAEAAAGALHLEPRLKGARADEVLGTALAHFGAYHPELLSEADGCFLILHQPGLLLYYANRLSGYGLESPRPRDASRLVEALR